MTRRLFIAFLLALVLPLGQLAAAAHELSHVRAAVTDKSGVPSPHCDLCAVAAALTGGGAASDAPELQLALARYDLPASIAAAPFVAQAFAFFLSRGPPSLR